jgi:hypothetical protein
MTSEEEDDGDIDAENSDEVIDLPHGLKMTRHGTVSHSIHTKDQSIQLT